MMKNIIRDITEKLIKQGYVHKMMSAGWQLPIKEVSKTLEKNDVHIFIFDKDNARYLEFTKKRCSVPNIPPIPGEKKPFEIDILPEMVFKKKIMIAAGIGKYAVVKSVNIDLQNDRIIGVHRKRVLTYTVYDDTLSNLPISTETKNNDEFLNEWVPCQHLKLTFAEKPGGSSEDYVAELFRELTQIAKKENWGSGCDADYYVTVTEERLNLAIKRVNGM